MGASQPQNVTQLHTQMREKQMCLFQSKEDKMLVQQSSTMKYMKEHMSIAEFDNLGKILKNDL